MPGKKMLPIETSLEKVQSKFKLVLMLSKRAKMLREYKGRSVEGVNEHLVTRAAREINNGDVRIKETDSKDME